MASVARPVRHASGSPGSDGIRASSPAVVAAAPDSASLVRQVAPLSTMPMLTRPPGTGAIPQYAPSGSTTMRASLGPASVSSSTCHVSPVRPASAGERTTPAACATIDRGPSAPTTTRAASGSPASSPSIVSRAGPSRRASSTPRTDAPSRTVAPARSASASNAGSSADRSKPTAVPPPASAP